MIGLKVTSKTGAGSIPSHLTTLSVSWLNNQLKAVAVHRGAVEGTWERPGESDGAGNFGAFLREAVQETGYHGQTVTLVLSHPRLIQQLIEIPPAKGQSLQKLIHRQAQQQKVFPGETAWASQICPSGKGAVSVQLHLFPRVLLNQLIQGCQSNGLHLTAVIPPSAVLQQQLTRLQLHKDQAALLAAETSGSTTLVMGRADSQILLARTLPGTWNQDPEKLALDLNRTVLFFTQQPGAATNQGVWLFGPGAAERLQALQQRIQAPLNLSPVPFDPFYWATEALKLRPDLTPNFIGVELQKAPQRRVFATVVAASTAVIVAASLGAAAFFVMKGRQEQRNVANMAAQVARMESQRNELVRLDTELTRKQHVVQLVTGDRPPPAPAWLLAYLAEAVPPDLVVTNLQVKYEGEGWKIKLSGVPQQGVRQPAEPPFAHSLALLKSRLADSPFHVRLTEPEDPAQKLAADKPAAGGSALSAWLNRVAEGLSRKGAQPAHGPEDHFVIEGVMR